MRLFIALVVALLVGCSYEENQPIFAEAIVIERHYEPSTSSSGSGMSMSGNLVFTGSFTPERYILLVTINGDGPHPVSIDPKGYLSCEAGSSIKIKSIRGNWVFVERLDDKP